MSAADLDLYRQLPSFMKLIENDRSKISLLTDDKEFKQFLLDSLEVHNSNSIILLQSFHFDCSQEVNAHSKGFAANCKVLHALSDGMPDSLFGKSLREVYINLLADNVAEDWDQFVRLIGLSSSHELRHRIDAALLCLKESVDSSASMSDSSTSLVVFSEELKRLEENPADDQLTSPKSQNVFTPQGKKLDKFELKAVNKNVNEYLKSIF